MKKLKIGIIVNGNFVVGGSINTIGFFGSVGATRSTLDSDATDAGTTMALVNQIRGLLINHGFAT